MKSIISDLHLKFAEKTWNETFQLVRRCMVRQIPVKLLTCVLFSSLILCPFFFFFLKYHCANHGDHTKKSHWQGCLKVCPFLLVICREKVINKSFSIMMMCYKSGTGVVMHWEWDHLSWKTGVFVVGSAVRTDGYLDSLQPHGIVWVVSLLKQNKVPGLFFRLALFLVCLTLSCLAGRSLSAGSTRVDLFFFYAPFFGRCRCISFGYSFMDSDVFYTQQKGCKVYLAKPY